MDRDRGPCGHHLHRVEVLGTRPGGREGDAAGTAHGIGAGQRGEQIRAAAVEQLPDDPDLATNQPKNSARLAVANVLGLVGEARLRKLQYGYLLLWAPDVEDFDSDD